MERSGWVRALLQTKRIGNHDLGVLRVGTEGFSLETYRRRTSAYSKVKQSDPEGGNQRTWSYLERRKPTMNQQTNLRTNEKARTTLRPSEKVPMACPAAWSGTQEMKRVKKTRHTKLVSKKGVGE